MTSAAVRELDGLLQWLGTRTGLTFASHQLHAVEVALRRAMARREAPDLAAYRREVERDPAVFDDLVSELTIGETYFFREPSHFEFVERQVLPDVRARRGPEHVIRCWSAGSSSGEEAYSLAILFAERGLLEHAHLIGTDVSRAALARALAATYRDWSFRGDGTARARKHFDATDGRHTLRAAIRARVSFEYLNLARDTYPSFGNGIWGMDMIFCRNVLIYFDRDTIRSVAQRLYATLVEGGWLITASSDPPLATEAPFEMVSTDHGIFYRRAPQAPVDSPRAWVRREAVEPSDAGDPISERRSTADVFPTLPRVEPTTPAKPSAKSAMGDARGAFARGDYAKVVLLTADRAGDASASALHVRALANLDPERALEAAKAAALHHKLDAEIHYLHAALLMELDFARDAAEAIRRVIYLDRTLVIAHFSLGALLQHAGDLVGAARAFRNARDLSAALDPNTPLPLSDGECAGRIVEAAEAHLAMLGKGRVSC